MTGKRFSPEVIQFHPQRAKRDCGVACLATYLGLSYEEVLIAAGRVIPNVLTGGVYTKELQRVARRLGKSLTILKPHQYLLDESTGILHVQRDATADITMVSHFVVLIDGQVYEGDGHQLWRDASAYLAAHHFEARSLLVYLVNE